MPSILNKDDKVVVKRAVPSPSNNIVAVAVARLYVNYPNKHVWNFTGISGAVVLAEDLVGHTFFFKIVDVIVRPCPVPSRPVPVPCSLGSHDTNNHAVQQGRNLGPGAL